MFASLTRRNDKGGIAGVGGSLSWLSGARWSEAGLNLEERGMMGEMIEQGGGEWVIETLWAVAAERRGGNRKRMGEVAESAFLHKAMELGLTVAKPWGDSSRYDFVVDTGERLVRVQVKSTGCLCDEERYAIAAHGSDGTAGYSAEEIDFLVAWVTPEDAWYVIPVEAFAPRTHLWLYPRGEHAGQYEKYREDWELLVAAVGRAAGRAGIGGGARFLGAARLGMKEDPHGVWNPTTFPAAEHPHSSQNQA